MFFPWFCLSRTLINKFPHTTLSNYILNLKIVEWKPPKYCAQEYDIPPIIILHLE